MDDLEKFAQQLAAESLQEVGDLCVNRHITNVEWFHIQNRQAVWAVAKIPLYFERIQLFIDAGTKFEAVDSPNGFEITNIWTDDTI